MLDKKKKKSILTPKIKVSKITALYILAESIYVHPFLIYDETEEIKVDLYLNNEDEKYIKSVQKEVDAYKNLEKAVKKLYDIVWMCK